MNLSSKGSKVGAVQEKPKQLWPTIKRLLGFMRGSVWMMGLALVAAVGGTVMQVLSPRLLGRATTTIFEGAARGFVDLGRLGSILLGVALLYLGVCIATFLQERLMMVVSQKTTRSLRGALKRKLNRLPISYYDQHSNGDLMSVAMNDVDNIAANLQQNMIKLVSSGILMVGVLRMMLRISPLLTLISCLVLPGGTLVLKLITPKAGSHNKNYWRLQGELNGQIEEVYQGFEVVKGFNGEEKALKDFASINQQMYQEGWKAKFFGGSMMPCMLLVENGVYILVAVAGAVKVIGGSLLIGDMQAFLQYSTQFADPITQFSQIWNGILSTVASAERVFQVLDAQEMEEETMLLPAREEPSKVVFDHVRFGYGSRPLMKDLCLEVGEGQMVAVVGKTGAGKTTLMNLLQRFYEIQGGGIRVDGEDIRSMSRQSARRKMGMVLQDTWLFSGTIYENIHYGNPSATPEQVYAAARAAFAEEFIQKLPQGYDTVLAEDGGNLSQGQRQLLTIARAFVADPEILILDEATSNVDSRTEMMIQKAMKQLLKGRTSFVVAHRLSTIYQADRIVVMEEGDMVETGSHAELLQANGVYADIYNAQFSRAS